MALEEKSVVEVAVDLDNRRAGTKLMKDELTELLIDRIEPVASEITRLRGDESYLSGVLAEGTDMAQSIARSTMHKVKEQMGLAKV